ncbi:MAG TPA: sulfotransferase [Streptosporangiaceae bacterium]
MPQFALAMADGSPPSGDSFADPVFVLCNGRSGSTLLRFLLDAHPDLACPPETNLPELCAQLATVWSLIEGAPLSANRGHEPPVIPDAAIRGVRETMDRMVGSYLIRRGKKRYCDKSLGTASFAGLLLRVYPQARFICLYRHPMDVIASGLEACPWGLNGYGFDSYIATTPGNAVLALARYWADNVSGALAAEESFPDRCIRVRYEDLVADPEGTAAAIFTFLGAAVVPGISATCFSADRERFGPGDHKIWFTSEISLDSTRRGWSIPASMIPPQVLGPINELTAKLGYIPVDGGWGTSAPPADLRLPAAEGAAGSEAALVTARARTSAARAETAEASGPAQSGMLGNQVRASLEQAGPGRTARWEPRAGETAVLVWISADPREPAEHWLVDLKNQAVTFATRAAQEDSDWDVVGSAAAWEQVITGKLNLSAALRTCQLRYCDGDDDGGPLAAYDRIGILGDLLGLATW